MIDRRIHARIHAAAAVAAAVLVSTSAARADDETAEAALKRGQSALKAGRVHEACLAFEASEKLDARLDTEVALADCYERDGRLMAASRLYRMIADKDTSEKRRKTAAAKSVALEAKAPRLRFAISPRPDGLVIKVDGEVVPSTGDVRVDVGPHDVVASAPGYEGHAAAAVDGSHAIVDVILRMEPKTEPAMKAETAMKPEPKAEQEPKREAKPDQDSKPEPKVTATDAPPTPAREPARGHRTRNGIILGATGAGLVIAAAVSFSVGSNKFATEHALCPSSTCATQADLDRANALIYNAQGFRAAGTGMMIGGGALLLAGAYLVATGHKKEASHVSLHVTRDGAGVAFTHGF